MKIRNLPARYQVRSMIGEGGSGRVYRIHDSIRDRELALKLVTPIESAWLRREFDTLRQVRHENLIQVFDWGALPSGEAYYTMELIEGGDWGARMGKSQSPDDVRRILTGLLRGLAHLHCHDEVHGDLKPGNILLGAGGVVKISDAGMGTSEGEASAPSGTPGYAAPEVWEGAKVSVRSDLYSVGAMAYEALTGRHPFAGRTVLEVVSGQLEGWVPSAAAHGVTVPPDLDRVVMRSLERQPELRQGSADEFMDGMGVEDRIGEILGGRLTGREKEIAEIGALLGSREPGAPTVIHLKGEPGVGKGALCEEISQRMVSRGIRAFRLESRSDADVGSDIGGLIDRMTYSAEGGIAALAEAIWRGATGAPLFLWYSPLASTDSSASQFIRQLGRYLWAISLERALPSTVRFALLGPDSPASPEPFERAIRLLPLDKESTASLVQSYLGTSSLEDQLTDKLHSLSGGNPGALRSALAAMIDNNLLDRRDGRWRFREEQLIQTVTLPSVFNHWTVAWKHLREP